MTGTPPASRVEVLRAEDSHAPALAEFIRQVWDPTATPDSVRAARVAGAAQNVAEPGLPPPTWIAVRDGRILGYVTTIPIRLWDRSREWPGYWIKGLMVLPEFRGGPVGYLVLKAAARELTRSGGLAVAPPARRLFEALGYTDLGAVPNWIRPIAPGRIVQRLDPERLGLSRLPRWAPRALEAARRTGAGLAIGTVAGALLRGTAAIGRFQRHRRATGPFDPVAASDEVDLLWQRVRPVFPSAVIRDAAYLLSRYPAADQSPYRWLAARHQGAVTGLAIVRRPRDEGDARLQGIRVATLADIWFAPEDRATGLALLGAAERAVREWGSDAIVASTSSPTLAKLLRRQWYLPLGGNVHLLFRETGATRTELGTSLEQWWLTRGDGGADEAF